MNLRTISIIILSLSFLVETSCKNKGISNNKLGIAQNDTTEIIRILLDSLVGTNKSLLSFRLNENNPFGDSIIFSTDNIIEQHYPIGHKLKLLSEDQICVLATQAMNDKKTFPNYISLKNFALVDSSYVATIQNNCLLPVLDSSKTQRNDSLNTQKFASIICIPCKISGVSFSMRFEKFSDGKLKSKIIGF